MMAAVSVVQPFSGEEKGSRQHAAIKARSRFSHTNPLFNGNHAAAILLVSNERAAVGHARISDGRLASFVFARRLY